MHPFRDFRVKKTIFAGTTMTTATLVKSRADIGRAIAEKILQNKEELTRYWNQSAPVKHMYIDNLLSESDAQEIYTHFPAKDQLMKRNTIREKKQVGIELEKYHASVSETLMAFQEQCVVNAVAEITGIIGMTPDPTLYASGLSMMQQNDFLNPHLDNSSDGNADKYRVINLLYYVTPGWKTENGGNLELWDEKVKNQVTLTAAFNRLAIMATDDKSWHSVSKVVVPEARRCLSNYYFAEKPINGKEYFHATTFKGRPGETFRGMLLEIDGMIRNGIRRVFRKGVFSTFHKRNK